jgi:hypothetical protein
MLRQEALIESDHPASIAVGNGRSHQLRAYVADDQLK